MEATEISNISPSAEIQIKEEQMIVRASQLKDPTTLSARDRALLKKHIKLVKRFERQCRYTNTAAKELFHQTNFKKPRSEGVDAISTASIPIFKNNDTIKEETNVETSKRSKSEKTVNQENSKKQKASSFDTTPAELQIAIISRDDPDGKITATHWLLVENEILKAMMATSENDSSEDYIFNGTGWREGVKVVCCGDHKSRDFLTHTIGNIGELWEGCSLDVVPATAIPLRQQISVRIPPPARHEVSDIVRLMAKQNKEIPILEWKLIHSIRCHGADGKYLFFVVDKKSDLLLKEKGDVLRYGLGTLKIKRRDCKVESEAVQKLHLGFNVRRGEPTIKMECDGNYHHMQ